MSPSSCWTFNLTKKLLSFMCLSLLGWNYKYRDTQLWYLMVKKEMHRSFTHCFSFLCHSSSRQQRSALWGSCGELADIVQGWCLLRKATDNKHMRPEWCHPNTVLWAVSSELRKHFIQKTFHPGACLQGSLWLLHGTELSQDHSPDTTGQQVGSLR